jgi:hypothetical protein
MGSYMDSTIFLSTKTDSPCPFAGCLQVPYDGNVTARCGNVGEALGAVAMFGSDVEVLRQSIEGLRARHTGKDAGTLSSVAHIAWMHRYA